MAVKSGQNYGAAAYWVIMPHVIKVPHATSSRDSVHILSIYYLFFSAKR